VPGASSLQLIAVIRKSSCFASGEPHHKSGPKLADHIKRLQKSFGISADENGWWHPQGAVARLRLAEEGIAQP
jgi:hypothetical protein